MELTYEGLRNTMTFVDMAKPAPIPTDAELEILSTLWRLGPSTVRDVHLEISKAKQTRYTTVLKTMQIMTEKGLLRRDANQRAHIYRAERPREATQRQLAGDLLERAFRGSPADLLLGALSARRASKQELAEIREMLDRFEKDTE